MARAVLSLKGVEGILEEIQKANGKVNEAAEKALKVGAAELEKQIKAEASAANVPSNVTNEVSTEIISTGNQYKCKVGWKLDQYDPQNLSQGYKALFLNYGTPHRTEHGQIVPRGFISRAKSKSKKNIKTAQQTALDEILKELKAK